MIVMVDDSIETEIASVDVGRARKYEQYYGKHEMLELHT